MTGDPLLVGLSSVLGVWLNELDWSVTLDEAIEAGSNGVDEASASVTSAVDTGRAIGSTAGTDGVDGTAVSVGAVGFAGTEGELELASAMLDVDSARLLASVAATGTGAAGVVATGAGATGTGAPETGAKGAGAKGTGATGTVATAGLAAGVEDSESIADFSFLDTGEAQITLGPLGVIWAVTKKWPCSPMLMDIRRAS